MFSRINETERICTVLHDVIYRKAADRILYALEEEGDREFIKTKGIEINGCVSVPESCSEDEFSDKFIDFVERNYWSFGGRIRHIE
jgi:hypothetical protein